MKLKHKIDYISSDKEMLCLVCGFITHSYKDMVEHLALRAYENGFESRTEVENCRIAVVEFKEKKK
jgi:hypothetical protein